MAAATVTSPTPQLPPPPSPSADAGIAPEKEDSDKDHGNIPDAEDIDIFTLTPVASLKILCNSLDILVHLTGDIPPTPPLSRPTTPRMDSVEAGQENTLCRAENDRRQKRRSRQWVGDDGDVPTKAKTPIGSPEARPTEPLQIVDPNMELLITQHAAVTRKFYSKKPPPISLEDYLMRLHRYCPMSSAVYLASSLYIHRLAVIEKTVPVTVRNAHRLVLAGLRVAMKALEDLSYPHSRFAKVGGVTENELGRLEISFCFVTDFNLRVTSEMLLEHAKIARKASSMYKHPVDVQPRLAVLREKRNLAAAQTIPVGISQETTSAMAR